MLDTRVEFLQVPFTINGDHQAFAFDKNAKAQADYFLSNYRISTSIPRVFLDPIDGEFIVSGQYNLISRSNYIMFRNKSYGNKYFYAYITDIKPQSGNQTVKVSYQMDSVQSYLFEWFNGVRDSDVVREHIGLDYEKWVDNTLNEDSPTGKLETVRIIDEIEQSEESNAYNWDLNKNLIRWAIFISSRTPAELDLIEDFSSDGGIYHGFGYKAKANKIIQTLNYYAIPVRTDMKCNGGDVFVNGKRAATMEEVSDFFAEDLLAVNTLIKVIMKNDIPAKGTKVEIDSYNDRIDITVPNLIKGNSVNIGGRKPIEEEVVETWLTKAKNWYMEFAYGLQAAADSVFPNIYSGTSWRRRSSDDVENLTVAGDMFIMDDIVELNTDGTVVCHTEDIFEDLYEDEPRLRFPPFTRYYIETENGAEMEFDATKLRGSRATLVYRTNMGPVDSSILTLYNYNNGNLRSTDESIISNQYEAFLQYSNTMSVPVLGNQMASMLQSQQNQMSTSLNHSLLDGATSIATSAVAMLSPDPKIAMYGLQQATGAVTDLYKTHSSHQAMMNDKRNEPNSVGQVGTDFSYNILNGRVSNLIKVKTVTKVNRKRAEDHLKKNGQMVLRLKRPNFESRTRWNHIQCDLNFAGAGIPQKHISRIKDTFTNGVTFWHTSDIYNYDEDNIMK